MFLAYFLKHTPPRLVEFMYRWVTPVGLSFKLLISTKQGVLLLVGALYFYCLYFSESPPWSFSELILWFDSLDKEFKTGVATSLLTVFGFLFTYHVASTSWKTEALSKLRLEAASELEKFFVEVATRSFDLRIFAESVILAVENYQKNGATPQTIFKLQYVAELYPAACANRDRLSVMSVEVHHLKARYSAAVSGVPAALSLLSDAVNSFAAFAPHIWLNLPRVENLQLEDVEKYASRIDLKSCTNYVEVLDKTYNKMVVSLGGVRGVLLQEIVDLNFAMIWQNRASLRDTIETFHHKKN